MKNNVTGLVKKLMPGGKPVSIPVVKMSGMIASGGTAFRPSLSLSSVAESLERAFGVKKAPAVAIVVNSPGGSPVQSRLIYKRIRDLAAEKNKKVHVFVEDVAASGGYMIACAGDDITVDPSSVVGSIGVISSSFGFVEAIDKLGVERRVYTAGQNKSVLDPFLPAKKADIDRLKKLQLEIHGVFIDLVRESRGRHLKEVDDLFSGAFWTGMKALELGLVDGIGDIRDTLRERYGDKVELTLIEPKKGLFGRRASGGGIAIDQAALGAGLADGVASLAEEKALWARYGL